MGVAFFEPLELDYLKLKQDVDRDIFPLISVLNSIKDVYTLYSCSGHIGEPISTYVDLVSLDKDFYEYLKKGPKKKLNFDWEIEKKKDGTISLRITNSETITPKIMKKIKEDLSKWEDYVKKYKKKTASTTFDNSSLIIDKIPKSLIEKIKEIQKEIPKEKLNEKIDDSWIDRGIQKNFHITLLYGIDRKDLKKIKEILSGYDNPQNIEKYKYPIKIQSNGIEYFDNKNEGSVCVLKLYSEDLEALHYKLRHNIKNKHREGPYKGHITIAYLKYGERLNINEDELKGISWVINKNDIKFAGKDGKIYKIASNNLFRLFYLDSVGIKDEILLDNVYTEFIRKIERDLQKIQSKKDLASETLKKEWVKALDILQTNKDEKDYNKKMIALNEALNILHSNLKGTNIDWSIFKFDLPTFNTLNAVAFKKEAQSTYLEIGFWLSPEGKEFVVEPGSSHQSWIYEVAGENDIPWAENKEPEIEELLENGWIRGLFLDDEINFTIYSDKQLDRVEDYLIDNNVLKHISKVTIDFLDSGESIALDSKDILEEGLRRAIYNYDKKWSSVSPKIKISIKKYIVEAENGDKYLFTNKQDLLDEINEIITTIKNFKEYNNDFDYSRGDINITIGDISGNIAYFPRESKNDYSNLKFILNHPEVISFIIFRDPYEDRIWIKDSSDIAVKEYLGDFKSYYENKKQSFISIKDKLRKEANWILVTTPKRELENIEKENRAMEEKGGVQFWNMKRKPTKLNIGDRIYFVKDGYIDNYQIVEDIVEGQMYDDVNNRKYNGYNLILSYPPVYLKKKIPYKGFQGFRYIKDNLKEQLEKVENSEKQSFISIKDKLKKRAKLITKKELLDWAEKAQNEVIDKILQRIKNKIRLRCKYEYDKDIVNAIMQYFIDNYNVKKEDLYSPVVLMTPEEYRILKHTLDLKKYKQASIINFNQSLFYKVIEWVSAHKKGETSKYKKIPTFILEFCRKYSCFYSGIVYKGIRWINEYEPWNSPFGKFQIGTVLEINPNNNWISTSKDFDIALMFTISNGILPNLPRKTLFGYSKIYDSSGIVVEIKTNNGIAINKIFQIFENLYEELPHDIRTIFDSLPMFGSEEEILVKESKGKVVDYIDYRINEKQASIIDYPYPTLPKDLWDEKNGEYKLKPKVRKKIIKIVNEVLDKNFKGKENWFKTILLGGSTGTQFYDSDESDVDVKIVIDYDKFLKDNPEYKKFLKKAFFPEHPDTIIIEPNQYYTKGLTEKDVYEYYNSVKDKMLAFFDGNEILLFIKIDHKTIVKRKVDDKFIKVTSEKLFDKYNNGRTIEWHIVWGKRVDKYVIDLDPHEKFGNFKKVKDYAKRIGNLLRKQPEVERVEYRFSGNRGIYIEGHLRAKLNIDKARKKLKKILEEEFKDDKIVTLGIAKPNQMRIDISTFHYKGSVKVPYSLSWRTGLISLPIKNLNAFKKEDAKIDKLKKSSFISIKDRLRKEASRDFILITETGDEYKFTPKSELLNYIREILRNIKEFYNDDDFEYLRGDEYFTLGDINGNIANLPRENENDFENLKNMLNNPSIISFITYRNPYDYQIWFRDKNDPNLKNWFGDIEVISKSKKQSFISIKDKLNMSYANQILYHGSPNKFDKFDLGKQKILDEISGRGISLTEDWNWAKKYALGSDADIRMNEYKPLRDVGYIYEIEVTKPIWDLTQNNKDLVKKINEKVKQFLFDKTEKENWEKEIPNDNYELYDKLLKYFYTETNSVLKDLGFGGIKFSPKEIRIFDPNFIKIINVYPVYNNEKQSFISIKDFLKFSSSKLKPVPLMRLVRINDVNLIPTGKGEFICEYKYDGFLTSVIVEDNVELWTRNGKREFSEKFPEIVKELRNIPKGTYFLGETTWIEGNKQYEERISSIVGTKDIQEAEEKKKSYKGKPVIFLFDILWYKGNKVYDKPLRERRKLLKKVVKEGSHVKITKEFPFDEWPKRFKEALKIGCEGLVFKNLDEKYYIGKEKELKPSGVWYKYKKGKELEDIDCFIDDYTIGKEGKLIFICYQLDKGVPREISRISGVSTKKAQEWKEMIDKGKKIVITIGGQEWTPTGKLRHPRFIREHFDKSWKSCNYTGPKIKQSSLKEYEKKRDFKKTPEPEPKKHKPSKTLHFVIQDHKATKHHWDVRFEDPKTGELISFVFPKRKFPKGKEKLLVIRTENHTYDYINFEGKIPEGYGKGVVKIEDKGTYKILEGDFDKKIIIEINGKKHKGTYEIYKTPIGYMIKEISK